MLTSAPHIARILERDPDALWAHVQPRSSRRLLIAALEAFGEHGFEASTTRQISTRASMSPAAVYVHYGVKLDLLQEILEVAHEAVWGAVSEAVAEGEGASERLRRFAEAFAAWNATNVTLARVAEDELRALPSDRMGKIRRLRRNLQTLVEEQLRRGIEEDGFDVPDLRGTTLAIIGVGADIERWYPLIRREVSVEQLARLHGELVLRMVRPWGR